MAFLRGIHPRSATPKEIAAHTRVGHEAVKKFLRRDTVYCIQTRRGEYRAFTDSDTLRAVHLPEPQVHNLKVVCPMSPKGGGAPSGDLAGDRRGVWERSLVWEGRSVTLQFTSGGLVNGRVSHPKVIAHLGASQAPLRVPEFDSYCQWLRGVLEGVGAAWADARVGEWEMNADYPWPKVKLAGAEAVTLSGFRGGLLKLYNKRRLGRR